MASKPESDGDVVNRPVPSKRALIEQRLRSARGVADRGLSTSDVMRLTRGEKRVFLVDTGASVKLVAPRDPASDAGRD